MLVLFVHLYFHYIFVNSSVLCIAQQNENPHEANTSRDSPY